MSIKSNEAAERKPLEINSKVPSEDGSVGFGQDQKPASGSHSKCAQCCKPLMTRANPLPSSPSCGERVKYSLRCPPHGLPARIYCTIFLLVVLYGCVFVLTESEALPGTCVTVNDSEVPFNNNSNGTTNSSNPLEINAIKEVCTGNFFALYLLFVSAMLVGYLTSLCRLPPLLGMLLVGFLLRNVPYFDYARCITKSWSSLLRSIALCIILLRAGLGLEPGTLRRLSAAVFRLAFIPCLVEATVTAICGNVILGFPWPWGFMLGFVLAAVSPAVIVPSMLALESAGWGVDKGIPTLVIAAASVDDVLAISGFQIFLSVAFSQSESLALTIVRGPLEALLGVLYGLVGGVLLWFIPHSKHDRFSMFRFVLLIGCALIALLGSTPAHVPGAGALACLSIAFVASVGWRSRDGWTDDKNPIIPAVNLMWWIIQPFLFGLIGAEVDIKLLKGSTVGLGIACLACGLSFRMVASFLAVFGTDLTLSEKSFLPFAWLPKATVQAAIGSVALDTAVKVGSREGVVLGYQVLTIAVLSILLTAPLGAALIALLAPRLLKRTHRKESVLPEAKDDLQLETLEHQA